MLRNYLPVLLLLGFVIFNAVLILGIAHLTVRPQPTMVKSQPYESGMSPLGDARERVSVKFYLVAMLFIVFDIELAFLYPLAVVLRDVGVVAVIELVVFTTILVGALTYVWRKGALEWR